jgi:hypothetical protein
MTSDAGTQARILVGAGCFADARTAMRIAQHILEDLPGFLGGLLVEDEEFLTACPSPNQRVVSASGAQFLVPSPTQVRTMMKADAEAFRQLLASLAASSVSTWTFERRQGELVESALGIGRGWDVLIVGYREINPVPGKVIALLPGCVEGGNTLETAHALARRLNTETSVFVIDADQPKGFGQDESNAQVFHTVDAAVGQLARTNARVVVIDMARGPIKSAGQIRVLLEASRCPVVILNSGAGERALKHSVQIPHPPKAEFDGNEG